MAQVPVDLEVEDETIVSHKSSDVQTEKFDQTIGLIEDLIMDEEFRSIQQKFLGKYADQFDPNLDENKFVYTDIHREYLQIVEDFILSKIQRIQSDFNLNDFMKQLESRQDEFEGEIFEFLLTFTDFLAFKQWMLEHRHPPPVNLDTCLQAISLTSAPLVEESSLSSSAASLDLGITGTKISKPTDPKKK